MEPHFEAYLLIGLLAVAAGCTLSGKIPNRFVRALSRSGLVALFVTPTIIGGHGGAYIGPALFLWIVGSGFDVVKYCVTPLAAGWLILLVIGLCFSWLATLQPRKPASRENNYD